MTPQPSAINDKLLIGVPSIDEEHLRLLQLLDRMAKDVEGSPKTPDFSESLSKLETELTRHFDSEERVIKNLGMPKEHINAHIKAHTNILEMYGNLNLNHIMGKPFVHADAIANICQWVINHLVEYDLQIRDFIAASKAEK